ncbi:MAG: hypothetical protein ACC707_01275, partial [Thiohalomonadales bacterium]
MSDSRASQRPRGQPEPATHSELRIYDIFVNVEGLRLRVPRPLFGFIPFSVSKGFGLYAVMILAAPARAESTLLLGLA